MEDGKAGVPAEIPHDDVVIVWHADSYDGTPLSGHAWYQGRYCHFEGGHWRAVRNTADPTLARDEASWTLRELKGDALLVELAARKLFEDMVGYHCTIFPARGDGSPRREMSVGGVAGPWKAFYEDPRWTGVTRRELDLGALEVIGTFHARGEWRPWDARTDDEG